MASQRYREVRQTPRIRAMTVGDSPRCINSTARRRRRSSSSAVPMGLIPLVRLEPPKCSFGHTGVSNHAHDREMSRSTIWRTLDDADLKPHRSVYWLNSHDPEFDAKAQAICKLYLDAPRLYQQGQLVVCCDEKTGMQVLERKFPTQP